MKKQATLAQQVRDAQRVVSSWSTQRKESARLEGSDIYLKQGASKKIIAETIQPSKKKG
jgi:hypothetical protein